MPASLGELAVRFGCELRGDPQVQVERVASLAEADSRSLSFLASHRYRRQLAATHAGAVVLDAASAAGCPVAALVAANPHATFARIATVLHPMRLPEAGVHAAAVVAPDARIDPSAHVGSGCAIGRAVILGARVCIGPGCILEDDVVVEEDVRLVARVVLGRGVRIGKRTLIQPGAVVGADGFGFAREQGAWLKVPQVGSVRVGADVEIGANTTIDRGAIDDTIIEDGVKLDNQVQIGHNVRIGAHSAIAGCAGVSGSVSIGRRCQIGGAVGISGHLSICDDVTITGYSLVSHSITTPGVYSSGIPVEGAREWRRIVGRLKRIDALEARVRRLEGAEEGESGDDGQD